MSDNPDVIRAEIEATRANLSTNVDALEAKVSPSQIAHRQADKVRDRVGSVRDRVMGSATNVKEHVMGSADDVRGTASQKASNAADTVRHGASDAAGTGRQGASVAGGAVREAPHRAAQATRGNPLAVGVIAFGLGWLVSSLIPASSKEQQFAASAKEHAQPLVQKAGEVAKGAAQEVGEHLR